MKTAFVTGVSWLLVLIGPTLGATIHVPAENPTIQGAIHEAGLFDTIIVAPGTYNGAINFLGKTLTLQSTNPLDPAIVETTVITTSGSGPVVTFTGGEDPVNTVLQGFTISDGTIGIDAHLSSAPIRHCMIRDNSSMGIRQSNGPIEDCQILNNGGAITDCRGTISRCTIRDNSGDALSDCYGTILDSRIESNATAVSAGAIDIVRCIIDANDFGITLHRGDIEESYIIGSKNGSGIHGANSDSGLVRNCVIAGNRGDGLLFSNKSVLNCTITGNAGGGIVGHRGFVRHCILWNNLESQFSGSQAPLFSGTTNPYFPQPGVWDHENEAWVHWDYHLTLFSKSYINAGNPNYASDPNATTQDIDGNPRVAGERVDIGAHEYQEECGGPDFDADGMPDNCDRDSDGDGVPSLVDSCDDTPLGVPVGADGRPLADLNLDCIVNLADFAILQNSLGAP